MMKKRKRNECRVCDHKVSKEYFPYCSQKCALDELEHYYGHNLEFSEPRINGEPIPSYSKNRPLCPVCMKRPQKEFFPYCSQECANIDLERWGGSPQKFTVNPGFRKL